MRHFFRDTVHTVYQEGHLVNGNSRREHQMGQTNEKSDRPKDLQLIRVKNILHRCIGQPRGLLEVKNQTPGT